MLRHFISIILVLVVVEVTQQHNDDFEDLITLTCKHKTPPTKVPGNPPMNPVMNPPVKLPVDLPEDIEVDLPEYPRMTPDPLPPGVPTENICPGGDCVPFHLCRNNLIVTDGEDLIDIRFGADKPRKCYDYLETCCRFADKIFKPIPTKPTAKPKPTGCGYRNKNGIGFKISGNGNESQYGEFPWMVAILREECGGDVLMHIYQCGGSLIHPKVVLTAAHCTQRQKVDSLKVRAGEWDSQTKKEIYPHQDRDVTEIIDHPQYHEGTLFNDISLLILSEPVEFEENVRTICLPPQGTVFDLSRCTASGWGKDVFGRKGKYQVILKKIELPMVPQAKCQNWLRRTRLGKYFNLDKSFICAGGVADEDTCIGDGGSPLVCPIANTNERYYQSGIVAWGIGCNDEYVPGVYANVALFKDWIDDHFSQRMLDTKYYTAS